MSRTQHDKLDELLVSVATLTERSENVATILPDLVADTATNKTDIAVMKHRWAVFAIVLPIVLTVGLNYALNT